MNRPDLAELLAEPARAMDLSRDEAVALLAQIAPVTELLRLVATRESAASAGPQPPADGDRLLTADEVAERTGVTQRWLRGRRLPFRVQVSPRCVRYSEAGLERWMRNRLA